MIHRSLTATLASAFVICGLPFAGAGDLEADVARMARVGACRSPSFSPDGSRLAFSLAPGGGMNQQIYLVRPNGMELRRLTPGGKETNWLGGWSRDGARLALASNRRNPASMDAYLFDLASGETALAARNPGIGGITDLAADGTRAVLVRLENRGSNDLFLRNLETGEEQILTEHEGPGSFSGGVFSPDGSTIYLSSDLHSDRTVFARIEISRDGVAGAIQDIAARDDAVLGPFAVTEDGSRAALIWNAGGKSLLEFVDLETLERTPGPELTAEIAGGLDFSADGRYLAMTLSGAAAPRDIWILDSRTSELRQVTHSPHTGVDLEGLVRPVLVTYPAHDGLELSGWLYLRSGIDGPAPFVLSFHGGPEGQERPRFRHDYQALLGRGIGVLAPNVRGSSGFGKAFVNLDNGPLRYDGIKDIKATVDFLVGEGIADPKRLGIMGGSYGGYMTMAGLAWYPELFAAGANIYGVVNFETFFAQTEPWMAAISTVEYGDPETEAELLRDLSPIHKVDTVRAPTIVLHGANDTNVPVVEAEQVVESLRERNVPVEYVLFPDEGHGFRKTTNRITATTAVVKWFEKYLKEPAPDQQGAWPQFRGPRGMPVGDHAGLPVTWSTTENVEWVAEIPGLGWSSPVVWGNRVFLTSTTSDTTLKPPSLGVDFSNDYVAELMKQGKTEAEVMKAVAARDSELPGEVSLAYHLHCLDLDSGRVLWTTDFHNGPAPAGRHRKNSYTSETPVTDGEAVYVYVAFLGLYAFDYEGQQLWHTPLEPHQVYLDFGGGASPALHGDRLFVLNDNEEDSFIAAFDKKTGKRLWRTGRPGLGTEQMRSGWSTPFVWENERRTEVVTTAPGWAISYDLEGRELWRMSGFSRMTIQTPFSWDGLVYVTAGAAGEDSRPVAAIRPGGSGDITLPEGSGESEHVAWYDPLAGGTYLPTPLVYGGGLYLLSNKGILTRLDPKTGERTYKARVHRTALNFTASPWAYNGMIFCLNEEGDTFVVKAGEEFELVGINSLEEFAMATPAIAGGRLLVRTQSRLYSLREEADAGS